MMKHLDAVCGMSHNSVIYWYRRTKFNTFGGGEGMQRSPMCLGVGVGGQSLEEG